MAIDEFAKTFLSEEKQPFLVGMEEAGYEFFQLDYSKKLSECASGEIVAQGDKRFLIIHAPVLAGNEKKFFEGALRELKRSPRQADSRADVYFFLKEHCLENMVLLNKQQREKVLQLLEWEALGESVLTQLLGDDEFEEIVINGPKKPIMVYHQTFGWLSTNAAFTSEEKIKTIINKMAAPLGRQLSYHHPMLNAVLANGSRLNASMSPVAFSGINATIRKFRQKPLTPLGIIESGTINEEAMAFLWAAMQTSSSILICGNTGSGKTTTLNALFCFLPKDERIVVVEETPELALPQNHLVKLNTAEQSEIGLGELIDNTFRMRPDRVIVGEIRNRGEAEAFINTMLAGQARGSYATFHAESAQEAIQRMLSFGIEKKALASIGLIVVQKRIQRIAKDGSRREERRIVEVSEVQQTSREVRAGKIFAQRKNDGELRVVSEPKKTLEKIMHTHNCTKKQALQLILNKKEILSKLPKATEFGEFFVLADRETQG